MGRKGYKIDATMKAINRDFVFLVIGKGAFYVTPGGVGVYGDLIKTNMSYTISCIRVMPNIKGNWYCISVSK